MGFKRLFFDIETSYCTGWFWRPSFKTSISYDQVLNNSAIICICYKWQGSNKIHSLKWDKGNDKEMIKKFIDVLLDADEVVGHNSDKFDLKWVRTRCLMAGVNSLPDFKSIDTLKISRSKFNFPSNRLDAIGKYLGFGGKKDTGGIQLWHDIIQRNSTKAMGQMIDYCKRDVDLLEKVFLKLEGYSKHKTHLGDNGADCPYCASERTGLNNRVVGATGQIKCRMVCHECKKYFSISLRAFNNR
jgi:DNA polymerase elongation subunit (family B)